VTRVSRGMIIQSYIACISNQPVCQHIHVRNKVEILRASAVKVVPERLAIPVQQG
jgi:hypothetical protein